MQDEIETLLRIILGKGLEIEGACSTLSYKTASVGDATARIGRALDEQREAVAAIRRAILPPW